MHVILPFEKNYYKIKHEFEVNYSGHPLVNYINEFKSDDNIERKDLLIYFLEVFDEKLEDLMVGL